MLYMYRLVRYMYISFDVYDTTTAVSVRTPLLLKHLVTFGVCLSPSKHSSLYTLPCFFHSAPLVPLVAVVAVSPSATADHTRGNLPTEALWVRQSYMKQLPSSIARPTIASDISGSALSSSSQHRLKHRRATRGPIKRGGASPTCGWERRLCF